MPEAFRLKLEFRHTVAAAIARIIERDGYRPGITPAILGVAISQVLHTLYCDHIARAADETLDHDISRAIDEFLSHEYPEGDSCQELEGAPEDCPGAVNFTPDPTPYGNAVIGGGE